MLVFTLSVGPAAISNVYKETSMKEDDLDVYLTTSFVSVWQEILGFVFLPLLTLQIFGGLSISMLPTQLYDGYRCFTGNSPSTAFDCSDATAYFLAYVLINFTYNVLLLTITKKGSAVLLVVGNALALPLTTLTFSSSLVMGKDVENFNSSDMFGLVCVLVGFLIYSSAGMAKRFIIVQGTPGQMTYTPVDGWDGGPLMLSASGALQPVRHASFLVELMGGIYDPDSLQHALDLARRLVVTLECWQIQKPVHLTPDHHEFTIPMTTDANDKTPLFTPKVCKNSYGSLPRSGSFSPRSGSLKRDSVSKSQSPISYFSDPC